MRFETNFTWWPSIFVDKMGSHGENFTKITFSSRSTFLSAICLCTCVMSTSSRELWVIWLQRSPSFFPRKIRSLSANQSASFLFSTREFLFPSLWNFKTFQSLPPISYDKFPLTNLKMTFNGFGTQAAWPDGTGFSASDFGDISKGGTSIRDLCQGMNNCVGEINFSVIFQT